MNQLLKNYINVTHTEDLVADLKSDLCPEVFNMLLEDDSEEILGFLSSFELKYFIVDKVLTLNTETEDGIPFAYQLFRLLPNVFITIKYEGNGTYCNKYTDLKLLFDDYYSFLNNCTLFTEKSSNEADEIAAYLNFHYMSSIYNN